MHAKRSGNTILIVSALREGEARSFPYMANAPVFLLNFSNNQESVIISEKEITRVMDQVLLHFIRNRFQAEWITYISDKFNLNLEKVLIFPTVPELINLVNTDLNNIKLILYPEPPLGEEEQNVLDRYLKNLELFSGLNDEEFQQLANISVLCTLEKGTIIYRQGNKPEYIYIISEGKIKSFSYSLSGKTVIATVSADLIGLQNIFSGEPLWVSAEAMNHVTALKVSGDDFRSFIEHKPKLLMKILKRAEKTMTCLFNRLNVLSDCSADQRVIDIFFGLYEKFGQTLPFRMAEIAALSGLTRETTIRVTSRLKKEGIIRSMRNTIIITDADRLRELKQYYPLL